MGTAQAENPAGSVANEEIKAVPTENNESGRRRLTTTGISRTIGVALFATEIVCLCPEWLMPEARKRPLVTEISGGYIL